MTTERWRRIEEIYQTAADLEAPDRSQFLDRACASDQDLRSAVDGLLAADSNVDSAIENAIRSEAEKLAASASELIIGKRIGPYRVTAVIGAGGMGTIYRAVRNDDQYQKEVAIKVVKRGMDLEAVVGRFRRERQILARLEHPNIARLIDGGVTDDGQPYFVMEYVEGQPLGEYCAGKPLKDRLLLFRQVCGGVQYAHQNLIVHRDLKPANILVTKDGVPKLLDFGLAKVLSPDEVPEQTYTLVRMLTPDYASPEQVRGDVVTTATDIYSLGAILYELVSGGRAHQFKSRTTAEMERVICRQDPPPLAGELGSIAQMAMHKEPQRRYTTVEQLSEDVRRYIEGLPVLARKDTFFYTFGKFVQRNKLAAAASTLALLILIGAIVLTSVQARHLQRNLAAVRTLATTMLFDVNRQIAGVPGSLKARETLVKTGLAYLERVASEAGDDPALQLELARAYESIGTLQAGPKAGEPNVGEREAARKSFRTGLGLAESLHRRDPANREVSSLLSALHHHLGSVTEDPPEAIAHLKESIRIGAGVRGAGGATATLADVYLRAGDPPAALQTARATPALVARFTEASALYAMGDLAAAAALQRANIAQAEAALASHPREDSIRRVVRIGAAAAHGGLGSILGRPFMLNQGDLSGAIREFRISLAHAQGNAGRDEADKAVLPALTWGFAGLGACLLESNPAESAANYRSAIKILEELFQSAPQNPEWRDWLARDCWEISYPLRKLGRREEALADIRRSLAVRPSAPAHNAMGDLWLEAGNRPNAVAEYQLALELAQKEVAAKPRMMELRRDLADCYERLGNYHAAAREWKQARDWHAKSLDTWNTWTQWGVSSVYDQRRRSQAERAVARYGRLLSKNSPEQVRREVWRQSRPIHAALL